MEELTPDVPPHLICPRCYAVFLNRFPACPLDGTGLVEMVDDLLVGKVIADRYLVEAFVGEGGMGRVYRARHTAISRRFAIKVLFGEYAAEEKARARFAREAEAASRLDHPNVVPVLDFGETPTKLPYLAMDFVEGRDLLAILDRERRLQLPRVLTLAKDMCRGLAHAHARGLVHRDFKPGNVLVVDDHGREVPRIADFGLAIDPGELSSRLTTGRVIFGSPAYMSPEQASQGELDGRADQFSLGVTLYELLTGKLPFAGSAIDQLTQNASARRPPLRSAAPDLVVPERVERLVHKLMAIWPDGRYAGMDGVIAELELIEAELARGSLVSSGGPILLASDDGSAVITAEGIATSAPQRGMSAPGAGSSAPAPAGDAPYAASLPSVPSAPEATDDPSKVLTHLVPRQAAPVGDGRRRLWLAVALIALLGVGIGAYVTLSGRTPPPKVIDLTGMVPVAPDAAPAIVSAPVVADAGAVASASAPDAAVGRVTPPPGGKRHPKPGNGKHTPTNPVVVVEKPPPPPPPPPDTTPPPGGEITAKSFTDYYRQVGSALERLRQQKGEDAAAPFRKRYFDIPLNDALRTPALRADAIKKLAKLENDIRTALGR